MKNFQTDKKKATNELIATFSFKRKVKKPENTKQTGEDDQSGKDDSAQMQICGFHSCHNHISSIFT